jgi:hypothetical protein
MRPAVAALVLVSLLLAAAGGREATARTTLVAHPRIWLDPSTMRTLHARVGASSVEWKALRAVCDTYAKEPVEWPDGSDYKDGTIGEEYQGGGYFTAVASLGLCYQVTKKAAYAAKGADVLTKMSAPDGPHAQDPLRDDGYGVRFYPSAMALGFDWLYPALPASLRARLVTAMEHWLDAYERDGFEHDFPQGNYFAGYYNADALVALATEGDDPRSPQRWADWLERVNGGMVQSYYAANLSGGGWPEGWNYGPLATLNMLWPIDAARTAKGLDLARGFAFLHNVPKFIVNFTWPNLKTMEDSGLQYNGTNPASTSPKLVTGVAGILERLHDPYAPVFHAYAARVRTFKPDGDPLPAWMSFLYWNAKAPSRDFRTQPLSYFAPGMDFAAMRSSWRPDAVWATFRSGPRTGYPGSGEESFDSGDLTILSGSKQFLVNATGALVRYTPGTSDGDRYGDLIYDDLFGDTGTRGLYNVFYVSAPRPTGQGDQLREDGARTAMALSDDGARVVMRGTHLEDMYPREGADGDPTLVSWTRDVVFVRPGIVVVHDRSTITDGALDQWLAWHLLGKPQTLGDGRYSVPGGTVQVLAPAGHVERVVDVFQSHKVYRLEVRPPPGRTSVDWVTVFEPGGGPPATLEGTTVHVGGTTVALP